MKDFFVNDAARFENQVVTTYFVLAALSVRERKGAPGQYLALTLADKTGVLEARMWEEFAGVVETCSEGCYVKVQGLISKYQGKFQITLQKMRSAAESEIEAGDFVPASQFDVAEMDRELRGYVAAFSNEHLRRLVLSFLDDPLVGPAFVAAPAAKRLHHAWLGGLLEHVLHLVRVCLATAPFYPEVDRDLLVTGAILHDIGKVRELSWKSSFQYTLEGQLIGHISIGMGMLQERIAGLNAAAQDESERFPDRLRVLLEHMILAHHGKLEFGSPKLPMTPEAMLLSALDDLEAKFQTLRGEFAAAKSAGKGAGEVTEWVRSMERPLFDSRAWMAEMEKEAQAEPAESGPDKLFAQETPHTSVPSLHFNTSSEGFPGITSHGNEGLIRSIRAKLRPQRNPSLEIQPPTRARQRFGDVVLPADVSFVPSNRTCQDDPRLTNGCLGKEAFDSETAAFAAIEHRSHVAGLRNNDGLHPYKCPVCGRWHNGHSR